MIKFTIGFIIGLIFATFLVKKVFKAPLLLEAKITSKTPVKIYTITNSIGEKEQIMTTRSMKELLSELQKILDINDNKN